jgi:hypothetical protein
MYKNIPSRFPFKQLIRFREEIKLFSHSILCKSLSCCGGHLEFPIHIAVLPMKIDMLKRH